MHDQGSGAHCTFTYTPISPLHQGEDLLQDRKQTPMFARSLPSRGSAAPPTPSAISAASRSILYRGGQLYLVGNNPPVFFFRDPLRFRTSTTPSSVNPRTGMRSAETTVGLLYAAAGKALHHVTMSDERGIQEAFRHMHGFGHPYLQLLAR